MDKIRGHPRRCLLGALVGVVAATALVIAVLFILRPAPLVFSVADARSGVTVEDRAAFFNLTLVAGNPSGRAAVEYAALDVRFKVGPVYTWPYNVKVSCTDVFFFVATKKNTAFTPIYCHG
uniref:Late embryogenesis abundant protein LEA-2 subgroup domain-containing protein n=1 Tax=Oryza brachyantha TaxID=4533 RepID=J3MAT6_ORYBR